METPNDFWSRRLAEVSVAKELAEAQLRRIQPVGQLSLLGAEIIPFPVKTIPEDIVA